MVNRGEIPSVRSAVADLTVSGLRTVVTFLALFGALVEEALRPSGQHKDFRLVRHAPKPDVVLTLRQRKPERNT